MSAKFSNVGLLARPNPSAAVLDSVRTVADCLRGIGVQCVIDTRTGAALHEIGQNIAPVGSLDEIAGQCDLLIVVGGDGSLLGVGRALAHAGIPVLGVNRGGLGFLADIAPEQIEAEVPEVIHGDYVLEDHFLLQAQILRDGVERMNSPALNDVVVHPARVARMLEFSLWVDDDFVYTQRSDGLIVASPTGSTAYALSAGGPIMHPTIDAIVIVPMFPHTLTSRPLVVAGNSELRLRLGAGGLQSAQVVCDSQVTEEFTAADEVRISKYAHPLRLLYPKSHSFYESCRSKLDWASRLGGSPAE